MKDPGLRQGLEAVNEANAVTCSLIRNLAGGDL
jgi:hypothetical protein